MAPAVSPLSTGSFDYDGTTVQVTSGVVSVRGTDELRAIIREEELIDGRTVQYRGDATYGEVNNYGALQKDLLPNRTVIEPDGVFPNPWKWFNDAGGSPTGNYTMRNVRIGRPQEQLQHNFAAPKAVNVSTIEGRGQLADVTGEDSLWEFCEFYSDHTPSKQGGLLVETILGMRLAGSNNTVRGCYFHNLCTGFSMSGDGNILEDSRVNQCYADFTNINASGASNFTMRRNDIGQAIGLGAILHTDGIQFQGPGSNGIIEGNTIYAGRFLNRMLTNAGDPSSQRVSVTSSTTLDRATHNGMITHVEADGLTLTLPANPALGDSYWFEVQQSSGFQYTVVPNTGQSHGEGFLPRRVSAALGNSGTFMTYWDGSQWRTTYGLRAGMHHVRAGSRTLDASFNGRVLVCDASEGDLTITLAPIAQMPSGLGVIRLDATPTTVTVLPAASEQIEWEQRGAVTSLDVTQDKAYQIKDLDGATFWTAESGSKGGFQGIFGNGFAGYENIQVRGNVIMAQAKHGFMLEVEFPGLVIENNTWMGIFPFDITGDGTIDSQDGFNSGNPDISVYGDSSGSTARRVQRNVTTGNFSLTAGGNESTPAFGKDNVALNITDATAYPSTHFNGEIFSAYYPDSRAEVLETARARPGGPLDGTFLGAVGVNLDDGFYDFVNGRINPAAPNSLVAAAPDDWDPLWVTANPGPASGDVEVVLQFACYSNPPLTAIEVEFDDSGTWYALPGATERGTFVIPAATTSFGDAASVALTGIRGVNSEGTGPETALSYGFTAGSNTVNFGDSLPTPDFSSGDWATNGETIDPDGWLLSPTASIRYDTQTDDPATRAKVVPGVVTMVVDVRPSISNPGSNLSASTRLQNVSDGPSSTPGYNIATDNVSQSSAADAGVIDLNGDGTVYRFWAKVNVATSGARIIIELPRQAEPNLDFRNPSLFAGDLTAAEIASL